MSWDEFVRAFWYGVLFPGFAYLSMVSLNQGNRRRSTIYGLLSIFFLLLLMRLWLLRYFTPIGQVQDLHTTVVTALGVAVTVQCYHYASEWLRDRRAQRQTTREGV